MAAIRWVIGLAAVSLSHAAFAHGIADNRYFPGTLTFDDPAVADELAIGYSTLRHPAEDGSLVGDDAIPVTFVRLLTPDVAFGVDTLGIMRNRGSSPQQAGFDNIDLTLKALLYRSDPREALRATAGTCRSSGGLERCKVA